jgi:serine/threonine-protein kinase
MAFCSQCGHSNVAGTRFCTKCGTTLTSSGSHASPTSATTEPTDPLLGNTIEGKYRFDSRLGAGGMGAVYKATRLLIGDTVAIKVLHQAHSATAQAGERFRREAQAAARLKHPNAVQIYDFGITSDGLLYLIMEMAEGQSLRKVIQERGALQPALAAEIMTQCCSALDEAHKQNIVHRDIKPDNIMVKMTANGAQVKILDFGIARLLDTTGTDSLTQTGSVIGTPHYMSPEQCLGEELDGRSDIYSLGVVLYEMLTGTVPFNAKTSREIISKHITQPPPPIRSIVSELSEEVEAVVRMALEKERESRPQSAITLGKALTNAINYAPRKSSGTSPQVSVPTQTVVSAPVPQPVMPPISGSHSGQHSGSHQPPISGQYPPYPTPQSMPQQYQQPQKRSWFGPFLIGGVLVFIAMCILIAFLAWLGSDEETDVVVTPTPDPIVAPVTEPSLPPAVTSTDEGEVSILSVEASTSRNPSGSVGYLPQMAMDGDPTTAWVEGGEGPGEGEWIQFNFSGVTTINRLIISPGYFKSDQVWAKNNRLAKARLEFSDGSQFEVNFTDTMTEQEVAISGVKSEFVRIVIVEVYPGATDSKDTAISEVEFE